MCESYCPNPVNKENDEGKEGKVGYFWNVTSYKN